MIASVGRTRNSVGLIQCRAINDERAANQLNQLARQTAHPFDVIYANTWIAKQDDVAASGPAPVWKASADKEQIVFDECGLHAMAGDADSTRPNEVSEATEA